jgi:hypothetical protein
MACEQLILKFKFLFEFYSLEIIIYVKASSGRL